MNQTTLDGCVAKVDRAEVLNECFASEWKTFLDSDPYPHRIETDRETGWNRVYFDFSTPLPPSIPVIVGEIAHDLRSALDHLTWREAVEFLDCEPTEDQGRGIAFPCARTRAKFEKSPTRRYVGEKAWTIMERYQPYKRANGQRTKCLGLLHWFNRMDKHRALQATSVLFLQQLGWPPDFLDWNRDGTLVMETVEVEPFRRLKGETQIVALRFSPNGTDPHVQVQRTPDLAIGFREIPRPLRGITLGETIEEVRRIIADFADLLP